MSKGLRNIYKIFFMERNIAVLISWFWVIFCKIIKILNKVSFLQKGKNIWVHWTQKPMNVDQNATFYLGKCT